VSDFDQPATPPTYRIADDELFLNLQAGDRAALDRATSVVSFSAGHMFYAPDDEGDLIYILQRGRVRLYKLSVEGRALTLLVLEPPAVFGEMAIAGDGQHDSFAEALTDCSVGIVRRDDLRRILRERPSLALRLMTVITSRLRAMEQKLADIAFKSVPQRLATVLLSLATSPSSQGEGGGPPMVVRYTHQQLAEMIGSYRETVTKTLGEFREAGMIRVEGDMIILTDTARFHALVGS
jgi:CRP-like cAMP-binding protein